MLPLPQGTAEHPLDVGRGQAGLTDGIRRLAAPLARECIGDGRTGAISLACRRRQEPLGLTYQRLRRHVIWGAVPAG